MGVPAARLVREFAQAEQAVNGPYTVEAEIAAFSPDDHGLLLAGSGPTVWGTATPTSRRRAGPSMPVSGLRLLAFSPDGRRAMAVGDRLTLGRQDRQEVSRAAGGDRAVFSPTGHAAVTGTTSRPGSWTPQPDN